MMNGVSLPPLGSFEFNLLYEGIRRGRAEKVAFARFLSGLIAPLSGMEDKHVTLLISQYAEEVMQFNYNSKYEPVYVRMVRTKVAAVNEDQRLLRKVDAMTVTDEDMNRHA
jgi:hypothetical protein